MSVQAPLKRLTAPDILAMKGERPVVSLTAYHTHTAALADRYCDFLLVGDSLGMVMHGYETTVPVPLELMIMHGRAVVRGAKRALVVVDMPFGSYEESPPVAFRNGARVMKETDCGAIKLEGGKRMGETIRYLVDRGIPVMAHIGLTPQSINVIGGFKVQGRSKDQWAAIEEDARIVAEAGAFAVVLEAIPAPLAERITKAIPIPTIGIGASAACDGQILVMEDMLGLSPRVPKFVKAFGKVGAAIEAAIRDYAEEVRARRFPEVEHTYAMREEAKPAAAGKGAAARGGRAGRKNAENQPQLRGTRARSFPIDPDWHARRALNSLSRACGSAVCAGLGVRYVCGLEQSLRPSRQHSWVLGTDQHMAEERDVLLREVDEELRREQLAKLWDLYGTYVLAGAAAIVIGIGGFKWWEGRKLAAAQAAGSRYEAAADLAQSGKAEEAVKAFEAIAKDGPTGYAVLASLRAAGVAAKAGKTTEAVAAYENVAANSAAEPLLRDFARLQVAALKVDAADWTEMQNRLNDLINDKNAWRYSARELLGLAAYRAGKLDEARQSFGQLVADAKVPPSIADRARSVMSLVVAEELARSQPPPPEPAPEKAAPAAPEKAAPAAKGKGAGQKK